MSVSPRGRGRLILSADPVSLLGLDSLHRVFPEAPVRLPGGTFIR